jgi:hypothetical protein
MEIKVGNSYIFQEKFVSNVAKGKVLEVTKTTYLIKWEDGNKSRHLKDEFGFIAIEEFENYDHKLLVNDTNNG